MARPCKWCGAFIQNHDDLECHEQLHRDLDYLSNHNQSAHNAHPGQHIEDAHLHQAMEDKTAEHESINGVDITCDECHKSFTAKSSLIQHQKAKHSNETFACPLCSKTFGFARSRNRHQRSCQGNRPLPPQSDANNKTFSCAKCEKVFWYRSSMIRHKKCCNNETTCLTDHLCPQCDKRCSTAHGLRQHLRWHENISQPKKPYSTSSRHRSSNPPAETPRMPDLPQFRCRRCTETFDNRHDLYLHGMQHHYNQVGGALQPPPWERDEAAPWNGDDALRQVYEANAPIILEHHRQGPIQTVYNFPVTNDVNLNQLMGFAQDVYRRQQRAFRLNLVFGVILQNRETGRYRYFVPYTNSGVFDNPVYVSRRADLQRLRRQLETKDILTELLRQRPDTKWVPGLVTNVHLLVTETFYPLGQGQLPDYLMKKESLYPLVKNQHNGKLYKDNLCAFRCLALHRGHEIRCIDGLALALYQQWTGEPKEDFEGLSFEDFPEFETRFGVNLEVYSLTEDDFARSVYKSRGQHDTTMYANVFENHLSYIRNFAQYAQKYQCKTCDRHFKKPCHLHRHQKSCATKTKFVYPGGFHQTRDSIFDQLDQYEINVPEDQRTFPWFMCYDFEAILQKVQDCPTDTLQWTQKHVPISVSICSNVDGHTEPLCVIDADQDQLVKTMVSRMNHIAHRVYELAEEKWGWVLEAIDERLRREDQENKEDLDLEVSCEEEVEDASLEEQSKKPSHPLQKLYSQLETYMSQVPVLGFNSAKYDLNLIKRCLAKHLNMHEDSSAFVVKKNNAYACIATECLKFLDMSQFLAPGSSYTGFLKAYHVTEQKGYFCYEWFDDVIKLQSTSLPPHEAFYSQLKASNISEQEYQYCQHIWRDMQMTTFRDFLVWYNNLDVGPFVEAVGKFQQFYFEKGVDVFKTAISMPGVARQLLFKTTKKENANFALFDKQNADLYQTIKRNIVGGPSIIFTRHHSAGETRIRGQKMCGTILGFDANALYLQAIGQPMPVGPFVRRLADNEFRPELRDKYMSAYYWMDWLSHTQGLSIQHKLNTGQEVRVGKYPVDGFIPATNPGTKATVFQFQGCYWHGHLCDLTRGIRDEQWRASRAQKFRSGRKTQETTTYLEKEHNVIEIWECEFRQYCRRTPAIYDFIDARRPGFFRDHKGKISEDTILEGVVNGALFGMVEVDIEVPHQWPNYYQHPTMTPYDYFQEMSPLFCTTEIPFEAIGKHMQDHISKHHLSKKPKRLLVGGMKARQILLATPLLRWYLNHGMVITKIYQVVEFQQQRCFKEFVREVSDARRQGDADPHTAIIADTMKVIGNSGYGSLIMDKTKHREVKFVQGENDTCLKVNDPLFQKLECLDLEEQFYEVEMAKRKIKLDLPIQLGYFILQYAKLRMLEFYYDFMDKYVDRADFEYCEMDTDSAYMAISGSCLDEVIKPNMRERFGQGLKGFCTDMDIQADAQHHWLPRTCCSKHTKYDKRTAGLFKIEYQGDEMISLCSKTYIVRKARKPSSTHIAASRFLIKAKGWKPRSQSHLRSRRVQEYKFSSKGISKRHLKDPMIKFRRVLKTHKAQSGKNRGFRVRSNAVFTYTQEKRGLYCKRKVLKDGIHTVPLDITLCPLPPEKREVRDQELIDMLASNFED